MKMEPTRPPALGDSYTPASTAAATAFRSPVGCTGVTPGEDQFLAWCQGQRIRLPSSHLASLANTGRALVASRAIKMGEVVVEVPDGAVLMAENCTIHEVLQEEGMCKPADNEVLEVQGLVIAVMFEKWRGDKSPWAPYLALLPDDMTHMPLYWKRQEFLELRGTAAYDKMIGAVQHPADAPTQVPLLWCEVVEPFISEHPELGLPCGQRGYDLFRWATCAVASYSFILGDDKYQAMVPVWDLLNHVTGAVNVRLHHCGKRHLLQMIATRDIRSGEELVNNYGELSNAELLRGYGFVEETNRNNHVQVPLSFLARAARQVLEAGGSSRDTGSDGAKSRASRAAAAGPGPGSTMGPRGGGTTGTLRQLVAARLRLGRRLGLLPQHHVFKVFKGRPPPAAMTALAFLLTASEDQAAGIRDAGRKGAAVVPAGGAGRRGRKSGARVAKQLHGQAAAVAAVEAVTTAMGGDATMEARVTQVYERVVERMLSRYCCSLEDDRRLMHRYDALAPRLRAALFARMPEKEALATLGQEVRESGALRRSLALGPALAATKAARLEPEARAEARTNGNGAARRVPGSGYGGGSWGGGASPSGSNANFAFEFPL